MFVIELIYKADLKDIDASMRAHMAFLKQQYAAGKDDPFVKRGLAEYRIIEFRASQRADDMPKRIEGQ